MAAHLPRFESEETGLVITESSLFRFKLFSEEGKNSYMTKLESLSIYHWLAAIAFPEISNVRHFLETTDGARGHYLELPS
jgi:hypothetical protein